MSISKTILVTGGAGYVGHVLVPELLDDGYRVKVFDTMWYENGKMPRHPNLTLIKGDIRDTSLFAKSLEGVEVVLHLACISNDPSFELDNGLSETINYDCFEPMVVAAKKAGVKRFVYCSSSSVYGVSDAPEVKEDHPLVPLTLYNRFKGLCEPLLWKHKSDDFVCVTIRPATICGYSPRTRLDLTVNILTNHAVNKGMITVFGGDQKRPNLHIKDMVAAYKLMIEAPAEKINGETFNIGYQNLKVNEIAELVKSVVEKEFPEKGSIEIVRTETNDNRSYHINSDKIYNVLGFRPVHTVEDAVRDLCVAFKRGALPNSFDDEIYFNVKRMKSVGAA